MSSNYFNQREYNGYAIHPETHIIYLYNSAWGSNIRYDEPVMDAGKWMQVSNNAGMESKVAAVQEDMTMLSDVFYDTKVPGMGEVSYCDLAKTITYEMRQGIKAKDENRIAAVITSKDYDIFQVPVILGQTTVTRRTGVLTGIFEEVATPQLSGRWATLSDNLTYHTFVPEGTTVDPSVGGAEAIDIFVPKHEGAVAMTQRAQMVIQGDNPLQRLTASMAQERIKKENTMVAAKIQSNIAHTTTGVDFGATSGSPPLSTTRPIGLWNTLIDAFDALNKGSLNTIISKAFIFNEYITNDYIRGSGSAGGPPAATQVNVNEASSGVPGLGGVTWYRDNAITSSTQLWALDSNAIKNFRGPTTSFNVQSQEKETTKNVLRSYFLNEVVDADLIYMVSAVAA